MEIFHISHTDLDGYSCQYLMQKHFGKCHFYNANYGLEVKLNIEKVLEDISPYKDEEILFFISDVNLSIQESKDLDYNIKELNKCGFNIKLQLLDHHITGAKCSSKFSWYFLDENRCATKIVYDYLKQEFQAFSNEDDSLEEFVNCVNAVDIWLDYEKPHFEFGKVLMRMISGAREINTTLFPNLNRKYRLYLLDEAMAFLNEEDRHILLDNQIHFLKKKYLKIDNLDDTLDNLSAKKLVQTLDDIKDNLLIYYKNHKGLLTYCLGSVSIPANAFLKANEDFDFFIDINKKGNSSLRANGNLDVALLAQKLAGGGGHRNASGAKFDDFKESINYQEVKTYIQNKLDNIN